MSQDHFLTHKHKPQSHLKMFWSHFITKPKYDASQSSGLCTFKYVNNCHDLYYFRTVPF